MTDVSSIALSSPTGLTVRGDSTTDVEGKNIPNGSLLVELRLQQPEPAALLPPTVAAYRVASVPRRKRSARRLLDELKKTFFEPLTISFDDKQKEYYVLIGQFEHQSEAARFLERLRKTGYENLRIISGPKPTVTLSPESLTDTNRVPQNTKRSPATDRPRVRSSSGIAARFS